MPEVMQDSRCSHFMRSGEGAFPAGCHLSILRAHRTWAASVVQKPWGRLRGEGAGLICTSMRAHSGARHVSREEVRS